MNPNHAPLVLVIDDEPDLRELLEITLGRMNINTVSATCITEAKQLIEKHTFQLCLTDMQLPDGNGLDLLAYLQEKHPHIPIAIITAYGTMETAIRALKNGAFDFISKPIELDLLRNVVKTALNLSNQHVQSPPIKQKLLGNSPAIQNLLIKIEKLARSQAPIYIHGPSGSGKELVAKLIHELGPRCNKKFVAINCGAIPKELMESEFFGHLKGSFTGAIKDTQGLFQVAHEGTLFLDEVSELPLDMQVKLLRAIQEKCIRPIGSATESRVDVRILSATHQNLRKLVQQGLFRDDLFYRINVIELQIPSLQERLADLPILTKHIINNLSSNNQDIQLSTEALEALTKYSFPGNIRELENILERALTLCENNIILAKDLQLPSFEDNAHDEHMLNLGTENLSSYMDNIEKKAILKALQESNGNKSSAAKLLGISLRTLRYRLKKLELE